jgi:lysine decarboxylase
LLAAWQRTQERLAASAFHPFTIPGHKQRTDLVGPVVAGDLPLYGGLAPIRRADDVLRAAERRAAEYFGADWCAFTVGGSTHGNQTLALALARPGRTVVVSRTLHRSMLLGLVLADLHPVWVHPQIHPGTGLPLGVGADAVAAALAEHPDACAVMLTEPSYVGTCADLATVAEVTRAAGVPLVVDAAWGAHFGLHADLPPFPLAAGADAVVTSAHKTLPAMNGTALILARTRRRGGLLDGDRLDRAVSACATTSPSGAALASLDGARDLIERRGPELAGALLERVERVRTALRDIDGVVVPDAATFATAGASGAARFDAAKLVVLLAGTGADGLAVDDDLHHAGIPLEMADRDSVIAVVTVADDDAGMDRLVGALSASIQRRRGPARPVTSHIAWTVDSEQALCPREAFFADTETVAWSDAAGRVSAELIAPYPPGIPVLSPGERITQTALAALREAKLDGARIAYAADPTLRTVRTVAGPTGPRRPLGRLADEV